jgi:type IV pilus assembly protein PilO
MLANRTSRWTLGTALLCIVLLAASWFLLISPRRANAADVVGQASQADTQANLLLQKIAELKAQYADLPKQQAELKAIQAQLPADAGIPTFVRDLQTYAAQAGVSLDSITPGSPALLNPSAAAATTAAPPAGSVAKVPVALTVTGDYFEASLFVKYLQTSIKRSYLITAISAAPGQAATTASTATTGTTTGTATTAPAASAAPAAPTTLNRVSLSITGSVFVLLDGSSTLANVAAQVKATTKTAAVVR